MGVAVAVTRAALNTTTGTQDFTTTALGGLTPKAALFFVTYATADGTAANHMQMAVGATDGTNHWVTVARVRNGVTTGSTTRRGATDAVVWLQRNSSNTIDIEAAFDSFITNGVRINITKTTAVALLLHVVLFAGSDLSAKVGTFTASSGDLTETTVTTTFQPDHLFFATMDAAFDDTNVAGALQSLGVAYRGGSIQQAGYGFYEPHGQTTSDPQGLIQDDRVTMSIGSGALSREFEVSAFLSDGFKLKLRQGSSSASMDHGYLALNYNGKATGYVGVDASPTSTGDDANTAPGFTPQFLMLLPTTMPALNTIYTDTNVWAQGVSIITSSVAYSVSIASEDAQTTTDTQSLSDDVALRLPQGDGTAGLQASLVSFDANGYTLNYSAVLGSARQMAVFAISVESTGTEGALAVTLGALTSSASGTVDISGASAATLGALTVAGAGTLAVVGIASVTLGALTSSATGAVALAGTLAKALDAATVTATGAAEIAGTLAKTLGGVTASGTGAVATVGAVAVTLGALTVVADGELTTGNQGALTIALDALTVAATGTVAKTGEADLALDVLTVAATGAVALAGSGSVVLGGVSIVALGEGPGVGGNVSGALQPLEIEADGVLALAATAGLALDALTLSATGAIVNNGTAAITMGGVAIVATASLSDGPIAELSVTLGGLTLIATGADLTVLAVVMGIVYGASRRGSVYGTRQRGTI